MQLPDIVRQLAATGEFVSRVHGVLSSGELSVEEVEELVERLQTALEEVRTLYDAVCEQSSALSSLSASAHAERERYKYLFDHAPAAYLVTDVHGTIREVNQNAAALLNTPVEFLSGVPFSSFVAPEQRPVFRRDFLRLGSAERVEEWHVTLQPHNMPPIKAALSVSTVPDPTGRSTVLRWLIRDATDRQSVATLWRAMRGRQKAVCTVLKTERGLEIVVTTEGAAQTREVFNTWEEVLKRSSTLRANMKLDGWQDGSGGRP